MSLACPECGTETESHNRRSTHFASRYDYECPNCGHEWSRGKWS